MSLMDKIKSFFSGGTAEEAHDHDHADADHVHEPAVTMPPGEPTGMSAPATGGVAMPEPIQPTEPERRDDL